MDLQKAAQQVFSNRELAVDQGLGRLHQHRIMHRGLDLAGVGLIGGDGFAQPGQLVAQGPPGVGRLRVDLRGAGQGGEGGAGLAQVGEDDAGFIMRRRSPGLCGGQGRQHFARGRQIALQPQGDAQ